MVETADILGLSRVSAWRKAKDGIIPTVSLGGGRSRKLVPASFFTELEARAMSGLRTSAGEVTE
jgi:hypothetical protein